MKFDRLIYTPLLHPALSPFSVPAKVAFMRPGHGRIEEVNGEQGHYYIPENFPFARAEAGAILREMIELGQALGKNGDLKLLEGQNPPRSSSGESKREERQLRAFGSEGTLPSDSPESGREKTDETWPDHLKNSQKVLLLAWELEENLLRILEAEKELSQKEQLLRKALETDLEAALSREQLEEFLETGIAHGQGSAPIRQAEELARQISWKRILEAIASFLPPDAAMFSLNREMYEDFQSRELLKPLPESSKPVLRAMLPELTEDQFETLFMVNEPLWKVLGKSAPDASGNKPWLDKTHHLLVALPPAC